MLLKSLVVNVCSGLGSIFRPKIEALGGALTIPTTSKRSHNLSAILNHYINGYIVDKNNNNNNNNNNIENIKNFCYTSTR